MSGVALELSHVRASYAQQQVVHDLSLTIPPSRFVTLLGPSGCGKSTTLRSVAGLHRIDGGTITIGDMTVAADGLHVRPEHRRINMVFQSYAIWPHLTVAENVGYGLKMQRMAGADMRRRVMEMLDLVGLADFAERHATGLSGGQQQRVALARALATRPRVLLLDEPLSNLDTVLRHRMRAEIMRIQRETGITALYVTHDCGEALSMSDEVVVMQGGYVAQAAEPATLYHRPASRFVATFLGPANILPGEIVAAGPSRIDVHVPGLAGAPVLAVARGDRDARVGDRIELVIRPEQVTLGAGVNMLAATVEQAEFLGSRTNITARSGEHLIAFEQVGLPPAQSEALTLGIDPDAVAWFPIEAPSKDAA
jgi:ABC-type Fe3+/spermidine/putrescine transport system ATPase subunit